LESDRVDRAQILAVPVFILAVALDSICQLKRPRFFRASRRHRDGIDPVHVAAQIDAFETIDKTDKPIIGPENNKKAPQRGPLPACGVRRVLT